MKATDVYTPCTFCKLLATVGEKFQSERLFAAVPTVTHVEL